MLPPPAGAWRSVAEMDAGNFDQVAACAARFGPLTEAGFFEADGGEPLRWWHRLVADLRPLGVAWTVKGAVADADAVRKARMRAHRLAKVLAREAGEGAELRMDIPLHHWEMVADGLALLPRCPDMSVLWRVQALASVADLQPMRRCRHCGVWIGLGKRRAASMYCSNSHRSLAAQRRRPP